MIDYTAILTRRYPGTAWNQNGDEYDGITWLDSTKKPTKNELDALWPEVEKDIVNEIAKENRHKAFSKEADPLYFGWQRGENTEQVWLDKVAEIRARYPYSA